LTTKKIRTYSSHLKETIMAKSITIRNKYGERITIKKGDYVGFKRDVEQCGCVKKIQGTELTLTSSDGFNGNYIGGQTEIQIDAKQVWLD